MPDRPTTRTELLQGTLDLLILQALQWGEAHGYAISQAIRIASNETFHVETGSLYPALHRLEKRGFIRGAWKTSDSNQRTKVYRLTAAGRRHLVQEQSRWKRLVRAMQALMRPRAQET